jgi:hypothetical protein
MSEKGRAVRLDGVPVARVTSILDAIGKPALVPWAAKVTAEYAVDHWQELADETISNRLARISRAHHDAKTRAAAAGTTVHGFGERLVAGHPVSPPDELRGMVEAYARFLDEWRIEPVAIETPVAFTGPAPYAGRADLWATIGARDNGRALVDLKTGKGVYPETCLQLAGYLGCDLWQPDGPASEQSKPDVDLVYVAHIRADRVDMLAVPAASSPEQWRTFRYAQQLARWTKTYGYDGDESLIGEPENAA